MSNNDREHIEREATERVMRARAELIQAHTFYGVLVSNVAPKLSRKYPTMATDGTTHYFNPDFIMQQTPKKVLGVQRHESEHDARRHHTRRGGRDPKEWNICTDYAINIDLVDEGVELPEGAYVDAKYRGWSAEDIYRARELDRAKDQKEKEEQEQERHKQQQQQEQEEGDGASAENADGDDAASDEKPQGNEADDGGDDQEQADDSSESGDAEGDESESGDAEASNDEGEGQGDEGDADSEVDGDPGVSDDGVTDAQDSPGSGEGDDADAEGEGEADSDAEGEASGEAEASSSGDPGGCGEVLDAATTVPELTDEDSKWERIFRQAASLAAKRGTAPGHITREIERADKPPQDWRETLRAWFDQGAQRIETWSRPNRRFIGSGIYMPGSQRDGLNRVAFVIDTSGSMDAVALACINKEAQAALDEGIIDEVVVVYGDTRVTRVDTYQNGDEIVFDPRGGGGTDLRPLFAHVRDYIEDASLIVAFSDMDIGDAGDEPNCPVLWAVTGYPDRVRAHLANLPWNAAGIDVGSH